MGTAFFHAHSPMATVALYDGTSMPVLGCNASSCQVDYNEILTRESVVMLLFGSQSRNISHENGRAVETRCISSYTGRISSHWCVFCKLQRRESRESRIVRDT